MSSGKTAGLVIGLVTICMGVPSTLVALNELGQIDIFPRVVNEKQNQCRAAEITLSAGSARKGQKVTVHGSCFEPGERITIRVHVTEVGSATADSEGSFQQTVTVPQSAPPPGFPTNIVATGRNSSRTATAPFQTAG